MTIALSATATAARALYRIDAFAGRGVGDGGPALAAVVVEPTDATTDAAGNVYFSDRANHRVRRVDAATGTITTVAGNGAPADAGDGGPATEASLREPDGVALDAAGTTLWVADSGNRRVRRVDLRTGVITAFAGSGVETHSIDGEGGDPIDDLGDGRVATQATLIQPVGLAVDADGNVYVADRAEDPALGIRAPRIRRIDHASGVITTFAGNGSEGFNGDGHPATASQLADPVGLQFDGAGNLWFGELGNHRVRRIAAAPPHVITTVAG
ncbi:MAG TPA: hypothetical protein VFD84_18555, partial [Candidatus Binatia bacterium]|nr:hypothetical protein [Candidatus Binatia bacterium]